MCERTVNNDCVDVLEVIINSVFSGKVPHIQYANVSSISNATDSLCWCIER